MLVGGDRGAGAAVFVSSVVRRGALDVVRSGRLARAAAPLLIIIFVSGRRRLFLYLFRLLVVLIEKLAYVPVGLALTAKKLAPGFRDIPETSYTLSTYHKSVTDPRHSPSSEATTASTSPSPSSAHEKNGARYKDPAVVRWP